ncbi:MAG: DUF4159 domain-containing protein [Candidatus Brocadiia bacterium]
MKALALVTAALAAACLAVGVAAENGGPAAEAELVEPPADHESLPDPEQVGGEHNSVVHVANLIYAGVKTSKCFSDHFLRRAENKSEISTSHRFHAVKLRSEDLYQYPFVIMTGEGDFRLADRERENLKKYCEMGGLVLASAGCSSSKWDASFRREMRKIWPDAALEPIPMDHPVFHTVEDIGKIKVKSGEARPLEGLNVDGKLAIVYSRDGLNDTEHTSGCCCCGGNEILNAEQINVNILAYALAF